MAEQQCIRRIALSEEPLQPGQEWAWLCEQADKQDAGALATFAGRVRSGQGGVQELLLEAYERMTQADMERVADEAEQRWSPGALSLVHRIGRIPAGDIIVFVGVASTHRAEAHAACEYLVDCLKSRVALWKKESSAAGERWLEPAQTDLQRLARWQQSGQSRRGISEANNGK